jgi:hypothetical protein
MVEIFVCCHPAFGCMGLAAQDFKFSYGLLMEMSHGGRSFQGLLVDQAASKSIAPIDWYGMLSV